MKRLSLKIIILSLCISLMLSTAFGGITVYMASGRNQSGLALMESIQRGDFDRQARDLVRTTVSMPAVVY